MLKCIKEQKNTTLCTMPTVTSFLIDLRHGKVS